MLNLPALSLVVLAALPSAPREYIIGKDLLRVDDRGVASLTCSGMPGISGVYLWLAGPEWKQTDQREGAIQQVAVHDREQWFTFRLTEPASGKRWEVTEKVAPVEGGLSMAWSARPLAEMDVNELSIIAGLPLAPWRGKRALLWPGEETVLPESLPADHHFASAASTAVVLGPGPAQVTLRLDKPRRASLQDARKFGSDSYQVFIQIIPSGTTRVKPGEEYAGGLTLLAQDPQTYPSPKPPALESRGPLAIRRVTMSARQVPQYGKLELALDMTGDWDNPFDPRQADVRADFRCPDGEMRQVPAFYYVGYKRELLGDACVLSPDGQAGWRVRFAPTMPGRHTFTVSARDRQGETTWKTGAFDCAASKAGGFVRRSEDPHYFRLDGNSPYFPVGENLCWYSTAARTFDYDRWLTRLHGAGANYIRLWMPSWAFGIEWEKPGVYRMDRAWELDCVLDMCERLGIRAKLTLENFRTFGEGPNPYDARVGGPCQTVRDFFTKAEAKEMFKRRLRYVVARWSYSPSVMAWELWNEINCVEGYEDYKADVFAWSAEMADYLREIDPNGHLTVNSVGSSYLEPGLWRLPQMDFAQMHGYYGWSGTEETRDMAAFVGHWLDKLTPFGKPRLFAEFGVIREFPEPRELCDRDSEGVHLHNGNWAAAMSGGCGGAMLWWWDDYVDPRDLYSRFTSLARFAADVPWTKAKLEPMALAGEPAGLRVLALRGPGRVLFWAQNAAHTWWNVVQGQRIEPAAGAKVTIRGLAAGRYRLRLYDTWACRYVADRQVMPAAGVLEVPLGDVARDIAAKVEAVR
jgi:hypothetical protein